MWGLGEGLDTLDVKILRQSMQGRAMSPLDPDFRRSYRAMARAVGVDEGTVRNRVRRFRETGFLQAWMCHPNPRLWGAGSAITWFDVPQAVSKDDLVEQLKLVPGVYVIARCFGTLLAAAFLYEDERSLRRLGELIRRMSKAEDLTLWEIPFPPCGINLSGADCGLLRSLSNDPEKSHVIVSKEVGLSSRTVKRRLQRLYRGGAILAFGRINPKALRGSVTAVLLVEYPSNQQADIVQSISAHLDSYLFFMFPVLPFEPTEVMACVFNLMLPNVSMAQEILRWVRGLKGIAAARVELLEENAYSYGPFEELMERRVGQLGLHGAGANPPGLSGS